MEIRQAHLTEIEYINELTISSKSYWGYSKAFIDKCRPHLKMTIDYIENYSVKVLEIDKEIRGYFSLKVIDGENRLDNLWIKPNYIKRGYGKVLFQEAVKEAKQLGWPSFRLAGEEKAIAFYEKQGAKLIGRIQSRLGKDIYLPHMEYTIE